MLMSSEKYRFHSPRIKAAVRFSWLVGAALALLSMPVQAAADDYLDLSLEQLLSTKVFSASKKNESLSETPAAVFVITPEDIRRSGATSIPEVLRMVPGVNVAQADSNSWAISIRGFQSLTANKLLVMIDGRMVYNPLFAGTYWEVQDVPLEDIMRIEVVRGSGGTLWGANAVNGVINILTKSAKDTQGTMLSGRVGTYENGAVTGRHGGSLGDDWYYRGYASYFDRDSFKTVNGSDGPDEWNSWRTGFRVDRGDMSSQDRFIVHGDMYQTKSDQMNTSYSLSAPFTTTAQETVESQGGNMLGLWRHNFDNGSSARLQSYIDYTLRDEELLSDDRWIFDTEAQYTFAPMGRHEFVAGGTYRFTKDNLQSDQIVTFTPASRDDHLFGAFLQDKITLVPEEWFFTLGSKIEHNEYTGVEIEPNARLTWTPTDQQTVWAAVSRSVRTPSRQERDLDLTDLVVPPGAFLPGFPTEVILIRNSEFDSEKLISYELGYRDQVTPEVSVDTTAFVNVYDNLISAIAGTPLFVPAGADPAHFELPIQAVNQMEGEVYGVELSSSWNVSPSWKLYGSYTFLNMVLHAPQALGASQDNIEDTTPQNQLNIRSFWNINKRLTLDTMAYYVDEIPRYDVDSYIRLDMNFGWKIDDGIQFNLVGQNLLDDAHREFGAASGINSMQVPRSVFAKLTLEF
jgi:iron complex outermembrane receptor protein